MSGESMLQLPTRDCFQPILDTDSVYTFRKTPRKTEDLLTPTKGDLNDSQTKIS